MKKHLVMICACMAVVATASAQTSIGIKAGFNSSTYKLGVEDASVKINLGNKAGFYVGPVFNYQFCDQVGLQTELLYSFDGTRAAIKGETLGGLINVFSKETNAPLVGLKDVKANVNMHNLRLPIMVKFQPTGGLSVMAGPYVSYTLATKFSVNDNVSNLYDGMLKLKLDAALSESLIKKGVPEALLDMVTSPALPGWDKVEDALNDLVKDNLRKFDFGLSFGAEYAFKNRFFIEARYSFSLLNSLKKDFDGESIGKLIGEAVAPTIAEIAASVPEFDPSTISGAMPNLNGNYKDNYGFQPKLKYSSLQIGIGYRF